MTEPQDTFQRVKNRMRSACDRSGRPPGSVRLVAVAKGQPAEKIAALAKLGQRDFGENYVQEWQAKRESLAERRDLELTWHFLGHLQSNKARDVVGQAAYIQSVDSLPLAQKIDRLAADRGLAQKALLEIQLAAEPGKTGLSPEALILGLPGLASLKSVDWRGLMAIPPAPARPEDSRPYFQRLKSLLDEINQMGVFKRPLTELSMGMSEDFEIAIEEGATMVRIGTALFGPRT